MQEGRPNLGPTFATAVRMCRRREASYWDSFDKAMVFFSIIMVTFWGWPDPDPVLKELFRFLLRIRIRNRIRPVKFRQYCT